jgi:uncharacterized membrane protein YdjX (TVP38/TMEM64 family)
MRRILQFLTNLDAKAWRSIFVSFLLFGGVGLVFVLGAPLLGLNGADSVERWMGADVSGPWAPVVAVTAFTALAFLGMPQFVLIAAAVVAFGPWLGFVYSWIGTLVSALVGFYLGRRFGAGLLRNYAGKGVNQFIDLVGRNGFWASTIVRLVPSAPFIVVNMAAGATPMSVWAFSGGCVLGSLPKIALTAFAGHAVAGAISGKGAGHWVTLALAAGLWIGMGVVARWWLKRQETAQATQLS